MQAWRLAPTSTSRLSSTPSQAAPSTGLTGTFTFDEHHDPVKSTAILTYVDGKPELKEMF